MKALIIFTDADGNIVYRAELRMDSPLFPPELDTPEKKLAFWLQGANEEPLLALEGVGADLKVTGELKGD